jgi:O-antigen/teichoic acid export membrane protein
MKRGTKITSAVLLTLGILLTVPLFLFFAGPVLAAFDPHEQVGLPSVSAAYFYFFVSAPSAILVAVSASLEGWKSARLAKTTLAVIYGILFAGSAWAACRVAYEAVVSP